MRGGLITPQTLGRSPRDGTGLHPEEVGLVQNREQRVLRSRGHRGDNGAEDHGDNGGGDYGDQRREDYRHPEFRRTAGEGDRSRGSPPLSAVKGRPLSSPTTWVPSQGDESPGGQD